MKITNLILLIILVLCIGLSISTYVFYDKYKKVENELKVAKVNEKAFISDNDSLRNNNIQYQITISQLRYFNDSLSLKFNSIIKQLKVKDSEIKNLQYLLTKASVKDSIFIRDTIFKEPSFSLDTAMNNHWYKIGLNLSYPNKIVIEPSFISEKYIVTNSRKETIEPPHNCFFFRLFQKKHIVVEVQVVEKSPFVETKEQRFIEIIE